LPAGFELNIRSSDVENLESWKYYDDELRKDLNRLFEEFEHRQDLKDDDPDNTALNSLADADDQLTLAEQWSRGMQLVQVLIIVAVLINATAWGYVRVFKNVNDIF
jgi:hypothetical protein